MAVDPMRTVGQNTPRVDAYERVTGKATYTRDIKLPGMLYARVLRSTVPHAMIRRIDAVDCPVSESRVSPEFAPDCAAAGVAEIRIPRQKKGQIKVLKRNMSATPNTEPTR